jgi:hypothetical protein
MAGLAEFGIKASKSRVRGWQIIDNKGAKLLQIFWRVV